MTAELVEFLLARQNEREQAARAADAIDPSPWHAVCGGRFSTYEHSGVAGDFEAGLIINANGQRLWDNEESDTLSMSAPAATHAARHDPAWVLADVEAKRRIMALHVALLADAESRTDVDYYGAVETSEKTLRLFALPHAGHEDYDESWRPGRSASYPSKSSPWHSPRSSSLCRSRMARASGPCRTVEAVAEQNGIELP